MRVLEDYFSEPVMAHYIVLNSVLLCVNQASEIPHATRDDRDEVPL